jgi:hypothetical protein
MQYESLDTELSPEYRIELPLRALLWKVGSGHVFGVAVLLIKVALSMIMFSPIIIATIIVLRSLFKKFLYIKIKGPMSMTPAIFGIGTMFVLILSTSALVASTYFRAVFLLMSIFFYVMIERSYYELRSRRSVK